MADRKTTSVDELYANRHRPYGQVRDGSHRRIEHEPSMKSHEVQRPQSPEDQHASNYDNRTSGWVRGAKGEPTGHDETATNKPSGFDRGNSWRKGRAGSLDWNSGSDPAVIRRPAPNKP